MNYFNWSQFSASLGQLKSFTCQKSLGEKRDTYNGMGKSHILCNKADPFILDRGCRLLRLFSERRFKEECFLLTVAMLLFSPKIPVTGYFSLIPDSDITREVDMPDMHM